MPQAGNEKTQSDTFFMLLWKFRVSTNLTLLVFHVVGGNSEFQLRIKLLSGGGVETLIVVEQHKRVGVNPAKREEGEYLPSNKTSTADLQLFTFRFADFLIPISLCCSVS